MSYVDAGLEFKIGPVTMSRPAVPDHHQGMLSPPTCTVVLMKLLPVLPVSAHHAPLSFYRHDCQVLQADVQSTEYVLPLKDVREPLRNR